MRNFISDKIHSVGKLEILLLLARNPEKRWGVSELTLRLRSNEQMVKRHLEKLVGYQLLSFDKDTQEYVYSPYDQEIDAVIKELIQLYSIYQVRIIQLIYETPVSTLQQFADAFKLRKDDKDGNDDST